MRAKLRSNDHFKNIVGCLKISPFENIMMGSLSKATTTTLLFIVGSLNYASMIDILKQFDGNSQLNINDISPSIYSFEEHR